MDKLIDLANLRALSKHNHSFIREILEVYLSNAPKDLLKLRENVESADWPMVRYFSHKLKSSSYTIGCEKAYRLFQQIEYIIKNDGDTSKIITLLEDVEDVSKETLVQVKIELSKYL